MVCPRPPLHICHSLDHLDMGTLVTPSAEAIPKTLLSWRRQIRRLCHVQAEEVRSSSPDTMLLACDWLSTEVADLLWIIDLVALSHSCASARRLVKSCWRHVLTKHGFAPTVITFLSP